MVQGNPLLQPYTSNIKTADFEVGTLHILVMNMFHQGSDGSLMVISAKANVHWSPLEDEEFDVCKSSLSWNSCGSLKRTMPTPLGSAKTRICIKFSSTLKDPLEINRFLYFLPPTVRFDSKSHHLLYDKQPPEKTNALQVSSLSFSGAFELWWRHCMWSHHIWCPSKANHKFFASSTLVGGFNPFEKY